MPTSLTDGTKDISNFLPTIRPTPAIMHLECIITNASGVDNKCIITVQSTVIGKQRTALRNMRGWPDFAENRYVSGRQNLFLNRKNPTPADSARCET